MEVVTVAVNVPELPFGERLPVIAMLSAFVVPPAVTAGSTALLTLSGINFQPGATIEFPPSATVDSVTVSACGLMLVGVTVAPGAASGPVEFDVVNPDGVFRTATLGIQ